MLAICSQCYTIIVQAISMDNEHRVRVFGWALTCK